MHSVNIGYLGTLDQDHGKSSLQNKNTLGKSTQWKAQIFKTKRFLHPSITSVDIVIVRSFIRKFHVSCEY